MDERSFQEEAFRLRNREYRYYYEANKADLPAVPDLSDGSGGLSNTSYFNFTMYVLYKIVAKHVTGAAERAAFCADAGAELAELLWPAAAARGSGESAREDSLAGLLNMMLDDLQAAGYTCAYQVVWGEHPGGWPGDWMVSEPRVMGQPPAAGWPGAAGPQQRQDVLFQVKLHEPADIRASVALRSEEDAFWGRAVSSAMASVLRRRLGPGSGGEASGGALGIDVDEYFYQDVWQPPTRLTDRIIMFFGDPLEQVGVDFTPSTLVQNFTLRRGGGDGGGGAR